MRVEHGLPRLRARVEDEPVVAPAFRIGDALREIEYEDIPRAGRLLYATAALSLVLFGAVRFLLVM